MRSMGKGVMQTNYLMKRQSVQMYWRTKEILSRNTDMKDMRFLIMQSLDMLADIISDTGSEQNIWGLEPGSFITDQ